MNITQLLHAKNPAGAGLVVNTTIDIATPQDRDGRKFYRQLYFLAFKLEPGCHGIVIDDVASQWQGWFNSYDQSLTASDNVFQTKNWTAEKEDGSTTPTLVKVHLVHPWRVVAVNTIDVRGVAVLRLDGDAVSDKATLSGNANSALPGEFIGQDFALRKIAPFLSIKNPQQEIRKAGGATHIMMAKSAGSGSALNQVDNIQAQAQANAIVASHGIKNILLRSLPTGPRILLGEIDTTPDASATLLSLWQQAGEQTQLPVTFFAEEEPRKSALQQLQQTLDRYFAEREKSAAPPALPPYLYLPIAFESDTPARLRLTALNLAYHLRRNRFDALDAKHTLKFAGGTVTAQSLTLGLPANSQITRAQFQVTNNLKPGFALNGIAGSSSLNGHTGIDLTEGSTVSNRVDNATPLQLQHLLLALLPLTDNVQATLQILRDNQDSPAGAVLAQTQLQLEQAGVRQWAVASIAPLLLDSGPCWLHLTVQQGRLFWLGQNAAGHVQFTAGGTGQGKAVRTLQLMAVLSAAGTNENGMVGLSVQVNNISASSSGNAEEGIQIDLAAGLNGHFGSGTAAPAPVAFVSGSAGNITVSNLQVEYNI